jgi:hypothetical protein
MKSDRNSQQHRRKQRRNMHLQCRLSIAFCSSLSAYRSTSIAISPFFFIIAAMAWIPHISFFHLKNASLHAMKPITFRITSQRTFDKIRYKSHLQNTSPSVSKKIQYQLFSLPSGEFIQKSGTSQLNIKKLATLPAWNSLQPKGLRKGIV